MSAPAEFRFRIDAYTPATIPMKRLAEYMFEVARLLGEHERVHFKRIKKGSAVLVQEIEHVAVPKVRERLRGAVTLVASEDVIRPYRRLDKMLADDNATGVLNEAGRGGIVVRFPGRAGTASKIGPIIQEGWIDGQLVRIGGEDRTAHAHLQEGDVTKICEVSREIARGLAGHLYGSPIRIFGRGRWMRTVDGEWELLDFKGRDFTVLDNASLAEIVARLRNVPDQHLYDSDDPVEELLHIRHTT